MVCGIHQLHYLPWLRYFDKIARSNVFVVLDNIQYNKNGWQNRNKIKAANGALLLTVPVHAPLGCTLDNVTVDNTQPWRKKHWSAIEQNYRRAPYFADHAPFLNSTYKREWLSLNELNRHMLEYFIHVLGIQTRVVYASGVDAPGIATDRLINLIRAVGADSYYSGAYAIGQYLDTARLESEKIALKLQDWRAPVYPQFHAPFVPDLSIVDLLMHCGPNSLDVILGKAGV
ncbi:MAG: WbqC family protein [Candidatus Hydrogenedentes bacterium]|nr:WbqC family protein [Candidatus Hydrogenedentota bacterium]